MSIAFSVNIVPSLVLRRLSYASLFLSSFSLAYVVLLSEQGMLWVVLGAVLIVSLINILLLRRFWGNQTSHQLLMNDVGDLVLRRLNPQLEALESWQVSLRSATIISTFLILICLRDSEGQDRRLIVFSDSISREARRHLRLSLLWLESKMAGKKKAKTELIDGNF